MKTKMEASSEQSPNTDDDKSSEEISDLNPTLLNMCISIIQDAITDLEIFEKLHRLPKIDTNHRYQSLEEKFGTKTKPEGSLHCLSGEIAEDKSMVKLQQDRSYVQYCLQELVDEISETQTTNRFKKLLEDHEQWKREEDNLLSESETLHLKQKQLENELEHFRIQHHLNCNEKDEIIGSLKDEYENLLREYRIKEDYVEKWEESRQEQLKSKLGQQEEDLENCIRDFTNKIEREKRVHKEIEDYNNAVIQDHYNGIAYWTKKYEEGLKSMEQKIALKKNNKLTQFLKITAITVLYKEREREMQAYEELKEVERQKAKEIAWINAQATRIQAWWRGVMVRRKLGPYKVKKPKPKGKGKSGK